MTGGLISSTWCKSITAVLLVLATPLLASTGVSQQQQQQQQQKQPRIDNSTTNQAATAAAAAAAAACPGGFEIFGHYCLHYDSGYVSQASAVDYCTTLGATLTYPINPDDIEAWVTAVGEATQFSSGDDPWCGASQGSDGQWTWVDGTQVPAAAWATGSPDGWGPCSYVAWNSDNGPLYDCSCDYTLRVLCQVTLEATTTTELPETTNPTVPSETTIRTETPTTTAVDEIACFSCISCPDVDDETHTEPKDVDQSCVTAVYDNGNVIRGVSPEFHQDGDCLLIHNVFFCYCNTPLCNKEHVALENIDDTLVYYENTQVD